MKIIYNNISYSGYCDIILTPEELNVVAKGGIVEGRCSINKKLTYIGITTEGVKKDELEKIESEKSDARI